MKLIHALYILGSAILFAFQVNAQVAVSPLSGGTVTVNDMVSQLIAGSSSVTTSNATFSGANAAAGTFVGGNDALGFSSGILLSTGLASNLIGAAYPSTQNAQPGNSTYFSGTTFDAAILSFSFIPTGDRISFRFRFISVESFGGDYSDAFGIFVNGNSSSANVALLPNGSPVTVTNITSDGPYFENGSNLGLNDYYKTPPRGSSVILQADAMVNPNQVNTIAFAIADAGDNRVDSVVIVGAGTFYSNSKPQLVNSIPDQQLRVKESLSYQVPSNTFYDADAGDTATYTAELSSGAALPAWLSFNATTRVFSGSPTASDEGTITIKIKVTDSKGANVSDEFTVTVLPELPSGTTLIGRVVDAQGAGISNAIVYIREASSGAVHGSTLTNATGDFAYPGVKTESRYAVSASRTGYIFTVAEALPGIQKVITGVAATFVKSVCAVQEQALNLQKIHSLSTDIRNSANSTVIKITKKGFADKATQAAKRVQTSLDALTILTDDLPELFLSCAVKDLCSAIKTKSSIKRLVSALTRLQKGAISVANLAAKGGGKAAAKIATRQINRLNSQALKGIKKIPASNYQCS